MSEWTTFLGQTGGEPSIVPTIVMMVGIFLIFYFLMVRPQQKRQKALKKQIDELSKGDRFLTAGGIYATVIGIKDNVVTARISEPNVNIEVAKGSISAVMSKS